MLDPHPFSLRVMIDGAWIAIHRAAAERPSAAPPELYVQPGSCLSMLEFPGD